MPRSLKLNASLQRYPFGMGGATSTNHGTHELSIIERGKRQKMDSGVNAGARVARPLSECTSSGDEAPTRARGQQLQ
jgi:hypothetical protein